MITPVRLNEYGIGQAINFMDGKLYLSMSGNGTIVEFDPVTLQVTWTGQLEIDKRPIERHPAGFAHKPGYPFLIGAAKRFIEIDWKVFRADGHLRNALIREIADPFSDSYSKAQYVEVEGRTYLVSADYLPRGDSKLRFYDMEVLADPKVTTTGQALAFTQDAPPWIQSIVAVGDKLALVRNRNKWNGWNIDYVDATRGVFDSFCLYQSSELEGFYELHGRQFFLTGDDLLPNFYVRQLSH